MSFSKLIWGSQINDKNVFAKTFIYDGGLDQRWEYFAVYIITILLKIFQQEGSLSSDCYRLAYHLNDFLTDFSFLPLQPGKAKSTRIKSRNTGKYVFFIIIRFLELLHFYRLHVFIERESLCAISQFIIFVLCYGYSIIRTINKIPVFIQILYFDDGTMNIISIPGDRN